MIIKMGKEGTCRATPPHVSWQGTNLLSSLILYFSPPLTVQLWRLVNVLSVSPLIVNSLEQTVERVEGSWFGGLWQAGGFGSGRLVALLDAPCHVFSGEAKAEAGWGEYKLASSLHTAGHQGQHTGVKTMSKGKKKEKRQELVAKLG